MTHVGVTTQSGTCAICDKGFPVGTHVYFDATKRQGKHLAHVGCFDRLVAERGRLPRPKKPADILSSEELDPPF